MQSIFEKLKELYWENQVIPSKYKEEIFYTVKRIIRGSEKGNSLDNIAIKRYIKEVLSVQLPSNEFEMMSEKVYSAFDKSDVKLLAYYLPQFYPTPYNDKWWGKGATEWRNVAKGMPQYIGHYQPRLPGELGFYDLRIVENMNRQVELAKKFGIYGFCFYYYWFDGIKLLDLPINNFFESEINFPFCFCWANENWSKQWFGTSEEPLIVQSKDEESYKQFITSILKYLEDPRYITVNGKRVLVIYRPKSIPNIESVLNYWREKVQQDIGKELYIIAAMNDTYASYREVDFVHKGFDAISEFCLGPQRKYLVDIRKTKQFVCDEFYGNIYDYKEFVENKKYFSEDMPKLYRAITPMWDNSARKVNKGIVFDGSTPQLYQQWLEDIIVETKKKRVMGDIDDSFIFINAWNEWSEGAYLEPDLRWGYGYLNATLQALFNVQSKKFVQQ